MVLAMLIRMGEKQWTSRARALIMQGADFSLLATGWRARRLRDQLPRLANAALAVEKGTRFSHREGNVSVLNMWLLLGFHGVFFQALAQGRFVSWAEAEEGLSIRFTSTAPDAETGNPPSAREDG
jgi:hypothetical protein